MTARQARRAQERAHKKVFKNSNRKLMYAGAFYKDDSLTEGFSIGAGLNQPNVLEVINEFSIQARKTYDIESKACEERSHPDYLDVDMDRIVYESTHNMHAAISEWNTRLYGSTTRVMGEHPIDITLDKATLHILWSIILGITYGELHGTIVSDNFNGMSFMHTS